MFNALIPLAPDRGGGPRRARAGAARRRRRRGSTSLLAMLYLALLSSMAIGFYAATNTSVQIAGNEQRAQKSQLAAHSGMQFMKYHLATLGIPASTPPSELFNQVAASLSAKLGGTDNLPSPVQAGTDAIQIPGDPNHWVSLGGGSAFRVTILKELAGERIAVRVYGRHTGTAGTTGIELDYANFPNPSAIFDYGVASRSGITMDSNARIRGAGNASLGSVLTTSFKDAMPLKMLGNASITGDVSLANPDARVSMSSNASIAGSSNPAVYGEHIHYGVEVPEFPWVDTSEFKKYATSVLSTPAKKYDSINLKNIYIKANTNPTFDSNIKVEGVIYIETPNKVTFSSNVEIRGAIVVQNDPTGDYLTNRIEFNSNVKLYPVSTLPATADFPAGLRALTGSMILAPKFTVHFNSNFGATGGCVIADRMEFDANARGSIKGSLINLEDTSLHFDSNSDILIESLGSAGYPAGVRFGSRYLPLPDTYAEVRQ